MRRVEFLLSRFLFDRPPSCSKLIWFRALSRMRTVFSLFGAFALCPAHWLLAHRRFSPLTGGVGALIILVAPLFHSSSSSRSGSSSWRTPPSFSCCPATCCLRFFVLLVAARARLGASSGREGLLLLFDLRVPASYFVCRRLRLCPLCCCALLILAPLVFSHAIVVHASGRHLSGAFHRSPGVFRSFLHTRTRHLPPELRCCLRVRCTICPRFSLVASRQSRRRVPSCRRRCFALRPVLAALFSCSSAGGPHLLILRRVEAWSGFRSTRAHTYACIRWQTTSGAFLLLSRSQSGLVYRPLSA